MTKQSTETQPISEGYLHIPAEYVEDHPEFVKPVNKGYHKVQKWVHLFKTKQYS